MVSVGCTLDYTLFSLARYSLGMCTFNAGLGGGGKATM